MRHCSYALFRFPVRNLVGLVGKVAMNSLTVVWLQRFAAAKGCCHLSVCHPARPLDFVPSHTLPNLGEIRRSIWIRGRCGEFRQWHVERKRSCKQSCTVNNTRHSFFGHMKYGMLSHNAAMPAWGGVWLMVSEAYNGIAGLHVRWFVGCFDAGRPGRIFPSSTLCRSSMLIWKISRNQIIKAEP